jgi:outer membrane protein assembly factor BamB
VFWGDGYGVVHAFEMPASTEVADGKVPRLIEAWRCDANPHHYRYDANGQLRQYPWTMGGRELAEIRAGGPGHIISTPVFHEGRLYVAIGRDRNYCLKERGRGLGSGAVTCIDPTGSGDVTDSHIVWRNTDAGRFHGTPSIVNGRMYLASTDGHLYCFDVADGRVLETYDLESGVFDRSQMLSDGKIYVASHRGEMFVFEAGERLKLLSRKRHKEHFATPTPCGRMLILPSDRAIRAYARPAEEGRR